MHRNKFVYFVALGLLFIFLLGSEPGSSLAQPDSGYSLSWWTVDGGGGALAGSNYTLYGAVGQADAGSPLEGNLYILQERQKRGYQ